MQETAEQHIPVGTKPSWFGRITEILRIRPKQTAVMPPPTSPLPEPAVIKPTVLTKSPAKPPTPTTAKQPALSGKELRALRIAEYLKSKGAEKRTETQIPFQPVAQPTTTTLSSKPEAIPANRELLLSREQIPWLEQPSVRIPLELRTPPGTPGGKFLYADFIHGRKLTEAANHLAKQRGVDVDKFTFTHLTEDFLKSGRHPFIKFILNPLGDKPIYCIYDRDGHRVYFIRRDPIEGFPVIIRVAACDKERQKDVLTTISDWKKEKRVKRRIERRGKN